MEVICSQAIMSILSIAAAYCAAKLEGLCFPFWVHLLSTARKEKSA